MRPLTRDAHRPLIAALRKLIGSSDNLAALIGGGEGPLPTAASPPLLIVESQLADAEFDVCGTIVADVAVNTGAPITRADGVQYCCLRLEILTFDD